MHTSYICHRHINKVKRYPVVYFLHGAAGLEISFMLGWHYADALNAGQAMDVILVAPHAYTELSFWMNSRDNSIPLETIIKQELIADVDSKYRTIAERKGRLIEGNSM
jgi:enterochelin esterase-like enzyme